MHLFIALLNHVDLAEQAVARFRQFGLGDPMLVRTRSAAAVLAAEVPVFGGLKSLALGADEDRLIAVALVLVPSSEEAQRLVTRVQLEMDADDPPMGKLVALPVLAGEPGTLGR